MRKIYRILFKIIFVFVLITIYRIPYTETAIASTGEFKTKYNVVYQVQEDGNTIVDQEISLTNQLTSLFATQSEITLGSANIYNISASDKIGKIYIKVNKVGEETKVSAFFNEKVVGLGKRYVWHLRYETPDLVSLNGLIKEINIPKLELNSDIDDYTLTVSVPDTFGKLLYVKPFLDKKQLFFNKDELSKGQISVAFGDYQVYNFNLSYYLKNTKITPVVTEIAIPPDTAYQTVYLKTLSPKPLTLSLDSDGNWLAKYQLNPEQEITIQATGSAQIFLSPKYQEKNRSFSGINDLLIKQKFWETDDEQINKLASELKTPQKIYEFVVASLKYDYDRVSKSPNRYGAKYALANKEQSICMEFTDLFIALARAAGIMAREVDGYAFTNNSKLKPLSLKKDILHAWPEYYSDKLQNWIAVDPTWENTTGGLDFFNFFDLNHFAFIKRGKLSDYPYPPGAYKNKNNETKDVDVFFGSEADITPQKNLSLSISAQDRIYSGFNQEATIIIMNNGNMIQPDGQLSIRTPDAQLLSKSSFDVEPIPPFGKKEIKVQFKPNSILANKRINLYAYYDNVKSSKEIQVKPVSVVYYTPFILLFLLIFIISLVGIKKAWKP